MKLIIGNKRLSSWSLRPWLVMKHFGIEFDEVLIPLDQSQTAAAIRVHSPAGKVPVLVDEKIHVWDSLAIAEYLNEKFPALKMWPSKLADRAKARSISAEMHSGFSALREHLSHDLQGPASNYNLEKASSDIARIEEIWNDCLKQSGGPYLFGEFSIADAMYAPVANRFVTYNVSISRLAKEYVNTIRSHPAHQEWIQAGLKETFKAPHHP